MPPLERRFVETSTGRVHVAICGTGAPILLLHQTPRSWDEYRDVLPLLGARFRAIAIDTPGFGDSEAVPGEPSIEAWAGAALEALSALGESRAAIVGHHTGAAVALEIAARAPERTASLVLSACPFVDAERRAHHAGAPVIDEVEPRADGGHLTALWARRRPYYPADDIDLLTRFTADALRAGPLAVEGHRVVNRYRMEERIGLWRGPTLVLAPTGDPHHRSRHVADAIAGSVLRAVEGAMVPFPDGMPEAFARLVGEFVGDSPTAARQGA